MTEGQRVYDREREKKSDQKRERDSKREKQRGGTDKEALLIVVDLREVPT